MHKLMGFLRLMRPANIVTAVSDILAGIAIAGYFDILPFSPWPIALLVMATIGLYGGGVVMNDYFDADLDCRERPERPIPSGLIARGEALALGVALLCLGVLAAFAVQAFTGSFVSGVLAFTIAIAALVYDKWSKHHVFFGPLNMGLCRGLNLLLGISIVPTLLQEYALIALVPILYIGAITMISQGEVYGGRKVTLSAAGVLYLVVMGAILYVSVMQGTPMFTFLFVFMWALMIFPPLQKAIANPVGKQIGAAVKAGVIALIVMNAAWASAFDVLYASLVIIVLLPLSMLLARLFAVT